jgi:hypothetical protein
MKSLILKIVLALVIIVLVYLVYESVQEPLRFNAKKDAIEQEVIQNLKDIRSSQLIYKRVHSVYSDNFDSLVDFLKFGEIPVVKMRPDPEDTTFTKTINDTIGFINVGDSLFRDRLADIDSLRYIPKSGGKIFTLEAGEIERGGLKVAVFEAAAHYNTFLKNLDKQLVINLIKSKEDLEHFPGLKVGSMEEPSTDGNWE